MYHLKEFPDCFYKNGTRGWKRFKKHYKRQSNKKIRQNKIDDIENENAVPKNYRKYDGNEIEW